MYKIGEVHFRLRGTNGFHAKAMNERFTAVGLRQNLKNEGFTSPFSRLRQKIAPKKRAARAARLFFLIQPIKSLICGVVVAVAVFISLILSYQLVWYQILVNNEPGRSRCLYVRHKWPERAKLGVHPMELCWVEDLCGPENTINNRKRTFQMTVESNDAIAIAPLSDWRQICNQWESKPKPITHCTRYFSRVFSEQVTGNC